MQISGVIMYFSGYAEIVPDHTLYIKKQTAEAVCFLKSIISYRES